MHPIIKLSFKLAARGVMVFLFTVSLIACKSTASSTPTTSSSAQTSQATPIIKVKLPDPFEFPTPKGRQLGNENATVTVEVFSDFQCPSCKQYATSVEPQIIQQYVATGKVLYVYHHYAIIGPESIQAANASMCAVEQNLFWEYHNFLFANQGSENHGAFADAKLLAFASAAGVDMNAFTTCFNQKRYQADIDKDLALGKSKGIFGVPSVFVNGTPVSPKYIPSVKDLQTAIDKALAQH